MVEQELLLTCRVLTLCQRCADWSVLSQFRITGTNASNVLMKVNTVRSCLRLSCAPDNDNSRDQEEHCSRAQLATFANSWCSSSRSTEEMMRGSADEDAVIRALSREPFIKEIYETGTIARKETSWLACSPDAITVFSIADMGSELIGNGGSAEENTALNCISYDGVNCALASVEIKTSVVDSSLLYLGSNATVDIIQGTVGDHECRRVISESHLGQILMHALTLECSYVIYVAASETGILYIAIAKCPGDIRSLCLDECLYAAEDTVK
jgi:hypothetical protein